MREVLYSSTRGNGGQVKASQAILKGLAEDGGLFVPDHIPVLDRGLKELAEMGYRQTAYEVMKLFLTDFTEEELKGCIERAYDSKFDTEAVAPLAEAGGAFYLELFHGPTIAFKDMALSILPHLMTVSARKNNVNNEIVILTATSGDTGKAALAGFAGVEGTKIIVFYPKDGVSPIQEKQMVTQKGDNTLVAGIHGNFDDAQTGVKKLFSDRELAKEMERKGYQFSSANSINIGRLVPQICYYVHAYGVLLKEGRIGEGEEINVVVPTGNFGNILAAYYAKNMGLPIGRLICASNENKVLYDFLRTGSYDRNREFVLTSSPSMDILVSSNLERLLYHIAGNDADTGRRLMAALGSEGRYDITEEMKAGLEDFYGNYATEEETAAEICRLYRECGYVIDTHTAVASAVYQKYLDETDDRAKTVIASTASPFKFTRSVMNAIGEEQGESSDFELADGLSALSGVKLPKAVEEIRSAPVLHKEQCRADQMKDVVREFLGLIPMEEMLGRVDHTLLKAYASWEDICRLCDEAVKYRTASVCVPPSYVKRIHDSYGEKVNICTVAGFPLGYSTTETKLAETEQALREGSSEIDMVVNIGDVKAGLYDKVEEEIRILKAACGNHILKVIIEACYLTEEEKIAMCRAVTNAGADYIKTSTGFGTGGASEEDVELFKKHIGPSVKIKAAGGISTLEELERFVALGCERVGTSKTAGLVEEAQRKESRA